MEESLEESGEVNTAYPLCVFSFLVLFELATMLAWQLHARAAVSRRVARSAASKTRVWSHLGWMRVFATPGRHGSITCGARASLTSSAGLLLAGRLFGHGEHASFKAVSCNR